MNLLKQKSDAAAAIIEYKARFERLTGNMIKKIVTDGGGEFCSNELGDILQQEGIQHTVSPPYTPQHNGIAKRANRTIIEMTRCMLLQSNMAAEWWGEAALTAAATTNLLPSLAKSRTPPITLFLKLRPSITVFKPFGCQAWILKDKVKRDQKFDPIAWEATFIGYANDFSAY